MAESAPGTTAVTDSRTLPSGVLPRGAQTWLMAAVAGVMVLIMFVAGRPEPGRRLAAPMVAQTAPSPERLRDYQDRLRVMEARAAQEAQQTSRTPSPTAAPAVYGPDSPRSSSQDSVTTERRRREYDSLFASNVVLSRRPEGERPEANVPDVSRSAVATPQTRGNPSLDDVADAVVRATTRAGAAGVASSASSGTAVQSVSGSSVVTRETPKQPDSTQAPATTRLVEGTIIDAVLTNRLDGGSAAPVNCLVTNAVYSHGGRDVLIPAGARILGDTKAVQSAGEVRLAVAFHRLVMPDGRPYALDGPPALNQIGDAGLRDQVNQHYWSTFGAAAAVGLISGLAQAVGTAGFAATGGDRTVIIAGPADASAQASMQVMNRLLNRLPTVTIREGHRVKVYLTKDLELPPYDRPAGR
jgi:type IV secretion system protein TrbI